MFSFYQRCVSNLVAEAHASNINPLNFSRCYVIKGRISHEEFVFFLIISLSLSLSLLPSSIFTFVSGYFSFSWLGQCVWWLDFQGSREIKRNGGEWRFTFARRVSGLCMINNERTLLGKEISDEGKKL